jgi:predicted RNase H-like nuclease (RuvC/YqgF family)
MAEMLVFNSGALTYVTINAIKEQQAMIERQSDTINQLKIELDQERTKIKALEQAFNEIKSIMKN